MHAQPILTPARQCWRDAYHLLRRTGGNLRAALREFERAGRQLDIGFVLAADAVLSQRSGMFELPALLLRARRNNKRGSA